MGAPVSVEKAPAHPAAPHRSTCLLLPNSSTRMPKSRRNKMVALTKTEKKVGRRKEELVDNLRKGLEEYASVYVFTFENMRSTQFKSVRARWSGSRFYLCKNKVMQIALGRSGQDGAAHDL